MLEKKLKKAIEYIKTKSPKDTSKAFQYEDKTCRNKVREINVIFPTAFALHSIGTIPEKFKTKSLTAWAKKTILFIKKQNNNYSFNYWTKNSKCYRQFPLPDDLDDTALCLSALIKNNLEISEKYFLKILQLESKVGGPYRTWYVNPNQKKWLDVDPIVNASLLYFTGLFGIKLPKTRKYILQCLKENKINSPYYPYNLMFLLYLSRYIKEVNDTKMANMIVKKLKKYKRLKPIEKLLHCLICAYLDINSKYFKSILKLQRSNGSLATLPFCYDFAFRKKQTLSGNTTFSTALFIELLSLKINKNKQIRKSKFDKLIEKYVKKQKEIIEKEITESKIKSKFYRLFPKERSYKALTVPYYVAYDIKPKLDRHDKINLSNLSIAIIFAWLGYTLQDEIIDQQRSREFIPISNTLIRISWKYYYRLTKLYPEFGKSIQKAFLVCDKNYEWEERCTRFDKNSIKNVLNRKWSYSYIKNRMAPYLTSLSSIPTFINLSNKKSKHLYELFKSQVIIDQLNDDAHDWKEDRKIGTMTYVLSLLYSISKNQKQHEALFWDKVMPKIIANCKREYKNAKRRLDKLNSQKGILKSLIDKTYAPIKRAEIERKKVLNLVKAVK